MVVVENINFSINNKFNPLLTSSVSNWFPIRPNSIRSVFFCLVRSSAMALFSTCQRAQCLFASYFLIYWYIKTFFQNFLLSRFSVVVGFHLLLSMVTFLHLSTCPFLKRYCSCCWNLKVCLELKKKWKT